MATITVINVSFFHDLYIFICDKKQSSCSLHCSMGILIRNITALNQKCLPASTRWQACIKTGANMEVEWVEGGTTLNIKMRNLNFLAKRKN